jgi:hypothetical protein
MVQRGRAHANQDVSRRPEAWLREIVPTLNVLDAALCGECQCFQIVASNKRDIFA